MSLADIEKQYGTRPKIPMGHGEGLLHQHARGVMADGRKFVWCPIGYILSWHPGDYDHQWCHWCQLYFSNLPEVIKGRDIRS